MTEKTFVPNTVHIPVEIHRTAKIEAAREGVTLQAWIIEAIRLRGESLTAKGESR